MFILDRYNLLVSVPLSKLIFPFDLGETSSGKSTIINKLIGEKILPTGVAATTSRVCRIRFSKTLSVSIKDADEKEIGKWTFKDKREMERKVKELATTSERNFVYVDICIEVPMLQVNETNFLHSSVVLFENACKIT